MALVEVDRQDNIAIITLNRPERMNALGRVMLDELRAAYREVEDDPAIGAAVLTGRGRAFCAGRDIKEGAEGDTGLREQATTTNVDLYMTNNTAKPLVSAVNGFAGGAGFYLATRAVDFVVAGRSAAFEIAEVPRGILHGWQTGFWANLSRAAARELAFGFRIGGQRAYDMGLANAVSEDADLLETALKAARHIARMPREVILTNRQLLARLDPQVPADLSAEGRAAYLSLLERGGAGDREFLDRRTASTN